MKTVKLLLVSLLLAGICGSLSAEKLPTKKPDQPAKNLYQLFQNPGKGHRPMMRWWWNGGRITEQEIIRELDLMQQAGIGGVEINTIKFPDDSDPLGYEALEWLSDEWVRLVNVAADACKERDMICDIIVGSGWPFGSEYLPQEQHQQMLTIKTIDLKGGTTFSISKQEILDRVKPQMFHKMDSYPKELMYLRLMPKQVKEFTPGVSYDDQVAKENITIDVPQGEHVLYCFVKVTGYASVIEGAPGAKGPILNHLDKDAVNAFLNRFSDKMHFTSGNLKGKMRGAFCDSFELEGANWSDEMLQEFEKRKGYSLYDYLPFAIRKTGGLGEPLAEDYGSEFSDDVRKDIINRVRNDFENVQTELFLENFIETYNTWCHKNGLKSRIQAYGRQVHQLEAAMYLDLPESETWVHPNIGLELPENRSGFESSRAYTPINKYVSSGAWLAGKNIVSCEEVTNVGLIFQTTLEELKVTGDRSNLSGVNQSIMHGFNYSPPQDDFLGWIKFGTYFSEKNTWWPYLKYWMDYKARISAVLQNSQLQADVAILAPLEDLWSELGQQREPFPVHEKPDFVNNIWEALHQNGNGCDYVSEKIIQQSKINKGQITFGARSYKTLMLFKVKSIDPATADMLLKFASQGGRIIAVGETPFQSVGMKDAETKSAKVKATIDKIINTYPDQFIRVSNPEAPILEWYRAIQQKYDITPFVRIGNPDKFFTQNYYKSGDKDIFLMMNTHIAKAHDTKIEFPAAVSAKQAWLWDAETGERYLLDVKDGTIDLHFGPAETKLIVFDNERNGKPYVEPKVRPESVITMDGTWNVKATHHVEKTVKEFEMDKLSDFNSLPFPWFNSFAGVIEYTQEVDIENPSAIEILDAGITRNGVTELVVNGQPAGVKWYGERKFDVKDKLHKGKNTVTIKVTTLLNNYVESRPDVPTARRWHWALNTNKASGLAGPVVLY